MRRRPDFYPPAAVELIERTPYRISFMVQKEGVQELLRDMIGRCAITDLAIEEEDIGSVVERIYTDRCGVTA